MHVLIVHDTVCNRKLDVCSCPCAALRIMEVRAAYCKADFEWDMMQSLANNNMSEANVKLLRSNAERSFKRTSSSQQRDAPNQQ